MKYVSLRFSVKMVLVVALVLPSCSEDEERAFDLRASVVCPPDAGPQVCVGGGATGGSSAQPDPEPEDEQDAGAAQARFVFDDLSVVDGLATLIISNCVAGALCRSASFTITNQGDAPGEVEVFDATGQGILDPVCAQELAPGQSCSNVFEVRRPVAAGNTLCLGRLSLSAPVVGQETLPVCLETFFGECLLESCR